MYPDMNEKKEALKKIYVSSIKASYFNHMDNNNFTKASKLQIETINEEEEKQLD